MALTLKNLIDESVRQNKIAHTVWTDELAAELRSAADDYSEPGAGEAAGDYWGTDDEGDEWRVELDRVAS